MNFEYSPLNPYVWGAFIAAWVVIWLIGNAYRKKHRFDKKARHGK